MHDEFKIWWSKKIIAACLKFEELREFYISNKIFFDDNQLGKAMGEIMGSLNMINNLNKSSHDAKISWEQLAKSFKEVIEPSITSVNLQFGNLLRAGE